MTDQERQAAEFAEAERLCSRMVAQEYWERGCTLETDYNHYGFMIFFRIRKLAPAWWSSNFVGDGMGNAYSLSSSLLIGGTVEQVCLPLLPTLVQTCAIDYRAAGYRGIPRWEPLRVRRLTKKAAVGCVPSWFQYEDTLVVPISVTAAPMLGFNEKPTWFDGLVPSTPDRLASAVELLVEFMRKTKEMFVQSVKGADGNG